MQFANALAFQLAPKPGTKKTFVTGTGVGVGVGVGDGVGVGVGTGVGVETSPVRLQNVQKSPAAPSVEPYSIPND